MADDAVARMGPMLEQLGARFELVLEAVTGFGGRLDALREEIVGQFAEVGRQIRFISDRIAENRDAIATTRADLGAEMIRLGEMLGATRVDFREQLAAARHELGREVEAIATRGRDSVNEELARASAEFRTQLSRDAANTASALRTELVAAREDLGRGIPAATAEVRQEISSSAEAIAKKLDSELKQTNKTLTSLARKFERFDDRVTVQTKDQDQRIRKLERRAQR